MKNIIVIILFFANFLCFSQKLLSGKVSSIQYDLYLNISGKDFENSKLIDYYTKANELSGQLKFELKSDSIKSIFEFIGNPNENIGTITALSFGNYKKLYYDILEKKFYRNNDPSFIFFKKNEFLIFSDMIDNWELSNETKLIDGKICFKATTLDYSYKSKNKPSFSVEAWYCPEIPIKLGPLNYNGLPGLILELKFGVFTYVVNKINFLSESSIIEKKPTGKNIVSEEEYYIAMENKISEMTEEYEKQTGKKL